MSRLTTNSATRLESPCAVENHGPLAYAHLHQWLNTDSAYDVPKNRRLMAESQKLHICWNDGRPGPHVNPSSMSDLDSASGVPSHTVQFSLVLSGLLAIGLLSS
jgi:hypothetical protein